MKSSIGFLLTVICLLIATDRSSAIRPGEIYTPDYTAPAASSGGGFDRSRCTYDGIPLHGRVQVVESFADIDVRVVESFPDLKVKSVSSFPDRCGEWEFVDSFPDFKVRFVSSFGDISVKFVESFPGVD